MTATVIALALFAAVLHATWNAFLRSGADRLWTVTVMSLSMAAVAVPLAFVFPLPLPAAWPYLVCSSCLQVGYSVFLVSAYRHGELGQVYPVVRGSVPLLVTLGGLAFAGERLSGSGTIGVALVAIGIMSLSLGRSRASTASILFALLTGLFIASYATVDAIGVRISGNARSYAIWIFPIYGVLMTAIFILIRGRLRVDLRAPETWTAIGGGMVSLVAYGAVIAAFALGPAGPITALRETSVVFAVLIGRVFLGEALTFRRIAACVIVAGGAVCLGVL
ncbi:MULTISPECIES: DMT family transporter [Rhizobium]|uniref:DMT family transporter n=1 Tax=Rhizobium rhododendri TaxID=2506430 RepID=A0ABY8IT15_9HYPH|nr:MULTISPECIES: DMT family transporter [Rhizobium]TQX81241.1 EamA family transporter [Rhizobium sp. rho-13.1]TQY04951.1 EamA family transporter [Rhizobium sp. rho-1.1]WFS26303.1 DMT family transporter [Rhizobium rhododendri]